MHGVKPTFTSKPPGTEQKTTYADDGLGNILHNKWTGWADAKRGVETRWIEELCKFHQIKTDDDGSAHAHILSGHTRSTCMNAFAQIIDMEFQSKDKHWGINPEPVDAGMSTIDAEKTKEERKLSAERMESTIESQLDAMDYDSHIKSAAHEGCLIGTGCVRGIFVKMLEKKSWGREASDGVGKWVNKSESVPYPGMNSVSVFNVYIPPHVTKPENISGIFERITLNRGQLGELRDDMRYDSEKINEILDNTQQGIHEDLWYEIELLKIAGITNSIVSGLYDVLKYQGFMSGYELQSSGVFYTSNGDELEVKTTETYWVESWVCDRKAILSKVEEWDNQEIPYHFFMYSKVPHQFWGISPARLVMNSQRIIDGSTHAMLDGISYSAKPMAQVKVRYLKDGQDPSNLYPGMVFLIDEKTPPSEEVVKFFQPGVPTSQFTEIIRMYGERIDTESMLPAASFGDNTNQINDTAKGLAMQLSSASIPKKLIFKNWEDGIIRPIITGMFEFNMLNSVDESIKGNHSVSVLGTSALMAKEVYAQNLMQLLNIASTNPLIAKITDIRYLSMQIAKSLDIDTEKAIPDEMPKDQQVKENALDQANVELIMAKVDNAKLTGKKITAEATTERITGIYEAMNAAKLAAENAKVAGMADDIFQAAGGIDNDGAPLVGRQSGNVEPTESVGTHPNLPQKPELPVAGELPNLAPTKRPGAAVGKQAGIEGGGYQ